LGGSVSELFEWSVAQTSPKIYAQFHRYEPLKTTFEDVSRLAQGVGLYEVTAAVVTDLLACHEQQLSNEDLEEMGRERSQQKEKEKEKDEELPLYV
jgi:hypothetical protein